MKAAQHMNDFWIDVTNPTESELQEIANTYHLHPNAVQDCLEPDHLPKYEEMESSRFIVTRVYDVAQSSEADTIQEVTRKISIFITDKNIITVHRSEQPLLNVIKTSTCVSDIKFYRNKF